MAMTPPNITRSGGLTLEAHKIENGFILVVAVNESDRPKIFYCQHEAAIGERIIALATEKKLQGQYEMQFPENTTIKP